MASSDASRADEKPTDHGELARSAEQLHRLLVESVQDYAIYALTPTGHVASWNPGAERLKGYTADEIIGKSFAVFFPPELRASDRPARELRIALEEGRFEEEAWRVRKDGTRFWATVIVTPIRNAAHEVIGFAKVTRDLTIQREREESRRALEIATAAAEAARMSEQELRRYARLLEQQSAELEVRNEEAQVLAEELELSNEELQNAATAAEEARDAAEHARRKADELQHRYQLIFESSPVPMYTVEVDTLRLLDVNDAALRRYGYSREEFLSFRLPHLRASDASDTIDLHYLVSMSEGDAPATTRHRTVTGELFDVEVRGREIMFEGKRAVVVVVSDVTAQLREQARQRFLVEATELLSASLDYDETLRRIVKLAVPTLADWAAYNVREGNRVRTIAIHHPNPDMQRLAAEVDERYPMRADAPAGAAKILATGEAELIREIPDDVLRAVAQDDEHYRILRSVGFRSLINVPVTYRGEVMGVLGFATGDSNRLFTEADLDMAREVARRAGIALQNARSFEAEQRARARAERNGERLARLQQIAASLSSTLEVIGTTEEIVREATGNAGADAAYVVSRCTDPMVLELVHGVGYPYNFDHVRTRFAASDRVPGADTIRAQEPIWIESHEQRNRLYPDLADSPISRQFGASVTLPLIVDGVAVGALGMHFTEERAFDADDRAFFGAFAEQAALALARARLFESEIRARSIAERLQSVTAALSEAATPERVMQIVVSEGLEALGAGAGFVAIVQESRRELEIVRAVGYAGSAIEPFRTMSLDVDMPVTEVVRTGEPVWIRSQADAAQRYPALGSVSSDARHNALAALPLVMNGATRGVIGLSFEATDAVAPEHRDFMLALARQCAQALERARLFEAEQRARRDAAAGQARAEFLAEASRLLGASLDYRETLESVARAAVPRLADWCAIDMQVDFSDVSWPPVMKRLAVMHTDPARIEWARELEKRQPTQWDAPTGLARVMRDGVTEFLPSISDELLVAAAQSEEQLAVLREIGFTAYVCAPLKVRGRTVGGITLVMADSKRQYTDADVALAEELATRASLAIENAELFREAQQANAAKAQFLAVMSHELRTPLNAIGGYAELLEMGVRGALTPEQAHDIQRIKRSQHHLLALINDVLNFARVEAGHVQYHIADFELGSILDEVVSLVTPQAKARDLTIEIEHAGEDCVAVADSEKVQQVLLNLLSNAVKFTLAGGTVTLSCHSLPGIIEITVKDTGIGIPPDRLAAIFDPFVQVQSGLTRSTEGTGLGLAISRDLARGMRGDLRVDSVLGEGSTFTLTLPRRMR